MTGIKLENVDATVKVNPTLNAKTKVDFEFFKYQRVGNNVAVQNDTCKPKFAQKVTIEGQGNIGAVVHEESSCTIF